MNITELKPHQCATIKDLSLLDSQVRKKLIVMGLLPNTEIKLIRKAPFSGLIQLRVRNVDLALRAATAAQIKISI